MLVEPLMFLKLDVIFTQSNFCLRIFQIQTSHARTEFINKVCLRFRTLLRNLDRKTVATPDKQANTLISKRMIIVSKKFKMQFFYIICLLRVNKVKRTNKCYRYSRPIVILHVT